MKKTLFSAAVIFTAAVSAHAVSQGTPPTFPVGMPNPYGNVDSSESTYTQTTVGADTLTLALNVTPHFSATPVIPPVNSPSVGHYDVSTGVGVDGRSFWNYDFAATSSADTLSKYVFSLTVVNLANGMTASYNPAPSLTGITDDHLSTGTFGNGESLDFTLSDPAFFGSIGYNPNIDDTYNIYLTASLDGRQVASDGITVVAGKGLAAPDTGSTMGLMSFAVCALGMFSRRFRK